MLFSDSEARDDDERLNVAANQEVRIFGLLR